MKESHLFLLGLVKTGWQGTAGCPLKLAHTWGRPSGLAARSSCEGTQGGFTSKKRLLWGQTGGVSCIWQTLLRGTELQTVTWDLVVLTEIKLQQTVKMLWEQWGMTSDGSVIGQGQQTQQKSRCAHPWQNLPHKGNCPSSYQTLEKKGVRVVREIGKSLVWSSMILELAESQCQALIIRRFPSLSLLGFTVFLTTEAIPSKWLIKAEVGKDFWKYSHMAM